MNIALFNNVFPPVKSGSSNFVYSLSQKLAARGHKVVVITSRFPGTREYEKIGKVQVYRLPCIRLPKMALTLKYSYLTLTFWPNNIKSIIGILKKHKTEIIQVHGQISDLSISAAIAKKKLRIPSILLIHTYVQHTNWLYNWILRMIDLTIGRMIAKSYDFIPAGEVYTVKYVKDRYNRKAEFYRGIITAVETNSGSDQKDAIIKDSQHIPSSPAQKDAEKRLGPQVILSVGHLHALRTGETLIRGMPKIIGRFPKAKLVFIGDVYTERPRELAKKLGVEKSVIFLGSRPHSETLGYIRNCDIHTYGLEVGFCVGKSSVESMTLGKPVISAVDEEYFGKDALKNYGNIVLVPVNNEDAFADAAIKLFSDKELMRRIGRNARKLMSEKFSWDNSCSAFEELYVLATKK